jgi:hypothetical protein
MHLAYVSLSVTVALAFVGYLATYVNNVALARRRERLELVSKQLNEFYGPLYLSSKASAIAYQALKKKLGIVAKDGFAPDASGDTPTMKEWRLWVTEVLMPMNLSQETIILRSAHLIREQEVPECLLTFVAHIAAWKALLKKWEAGEYSEQFSVVPYPPEVAEYAALAYRELKAEQLQLIGRER